MSSQNDGIWVSMFNWSAGHTDIGVPVNGFGGDVLSISLPTAFSTSLKRDEADGSSPTPAQMRQTTTANRSYRDPGEKETNTLYAPLKWLYYPVNPWGTGLGGSDLVVEAVHSTCGSPGWGKPSPSWFQSQMVFFFMRTTLALLPFWSVLTPPKVLLVNGLFLV